LSARTPAEEHARARIRVGLKLQTDVRLVFLPASDSNESLVALVNGEIIKTRIDGASMADERSLQRAAKDVAATLLPSPPSMLRMERIRGRPATLADLPAIATSLATLHRTRAPKARLLVGGSNAEAAAAIARRLCEAMLGHKSIPKGMLKTALKRLRDEDARLMNLTDDDDRSMRLCHGDLRLPNVRIANRRAVLLDFGLAGQGDPALDLARLCAYEKLDASQALVLMVAYAAAGGDPAVVERATLVMNATPLVLAVQALHRRVALGAPLHLDRLAAHVAEPRPMARGRDKKLVDIPRIAHLPGSTTGHDDLVASAADADRLRTASVTIREKLDGLAVAFYRDPEGDIAVLMKKQWRQAFGGRCAAEALWFARTHESKLAPFIDDGGVVLGEWLWHQLRCRYQRLASPCVMHTWLLRGKLTRSNDAFAAAGLAALQPHFEGVVGERDWLSLCPAKSAFGGRAEGIIIDEPTASGVRQWKWVAPWYKQPRPSDLTGARNRVLSPFAAIRSR
jgi:hypothetical protein